MRNRVSKAFTLVEILIVVVILGILAAIVIPQFTNASQDAQIGNVQTQLQSIRSQIELYRVRNNGTPPDLTTVPSAPATMGNGFAGLIEPPAIGGVAQQPYIRTAPVNPRNKKSSVRADANPVATAPGLDPAADADGWLYDATTGAFAAVGFDESTNKWFGMP